MNVPVGGPVPMNVQGHKASLLNALHCRTATHRMLQLTGTLSLGARWEVRVKKGLKRLRWVRQADEGCERVCLLLHCLGMKQIWRYHAPAQR